MVIKTRNIYSKHQQQQHKHEYRSHTSHTHSHTHIHTYAHIEAFNVTKLYMFTFPYAVLSRNSRPSHISTIQTIYTVQCMNGKRICQVENHLASHEPRQTLSILHKAGSASFQLHTAFSTCMRMLPLYIYKAQWGMVRAYRGACAYPKPHTSYSRRHIQCTLGIDVVLAPLFCIHTATNS